MFNSKQKQLFETGSTKPTSGNNAFLNAAKNVAAKTLSGNGAMKYSETSDDFVNQFAAISGYKQPRSFADISRDMAILYAKNPLLCVCFVFYIRIITRIVSLFDGTKTKLAQRGAGLKHEGIMRMMWLHIYYPHSFWKNIPLFISIGSWKDIFTMLSYDLQYNGWKDRKLDWEKFGQLLLAGFSNENTVNLLKKYMPQIRANSKCKTLEAQADNVIAKWLCSLLYGGKDTSWSYKQYRKQKSSGTAHTWQQLISQGKHNLINFNTIHGRALSLLVTSKYLKNQGLTEEYAKWIAAKPVAKFTGYVYELAKNITYGMQKYQIDTINKQYNMLLETCGNLNSNLIVVKDTSGSMDSKAHGTNVSSYTIAKSLSIFLGNVLKGPFHNHYIDFSTTSILREIKGSNFVEHWTTEQRIQSANTDFMTVAHLFASLKFKKSVNEEDFPKGIVCISDGEFDNAKPFKDTNINAFRKVLLQAGFSQSYVKNFTFVFWDIHNEFYTRYSGKRTVKFETYNIEDGVFYFSGFDPSVMAFLTNQSSSDKPAPKNARDLFDAAMSQEIMQMIEL